MQNALIEFTELTQIEMIEYYLKMLEIQKLLLAWINFFMETILNPFKTNLNWKMSNFAIKEIERNLENFIYILNKTYRNGNDMIWSIDINGKKMNSKLIKCTLPFPRVNASQQKHSTVNNFKHKYDFLNMGKKNLTWKKFVFFWKKTILGILKDFKTKKLA